MKPKKIRAGQSTISARSWNSFVDMHSDFYKNGVSLNEGSIDASSVIVPCLLKDGENDIAAHTVVKVLEPISYANFSETSQSYVVTPVNGVVETPWRYGVTGANGVTSGRGGFVTVSGIALISVTRNQMVDGTFLPEYSSGVPEDQYTGLWDSMFYVVPDQTISSNTNIVIAPTGHFKIMNSYDITKVKDTHTTDTDAILLAVDLDKRPSTVRVLTTASIAAPDELEEEVDPTPEEPDSGDETMEPTGESVISSVEAAVFYEMVATTVITDKKSIMKSDNWKIKVFNMTDASVDAGVHTATYSEEYNCFVILVGAASGVFPIAMTWEDPDAAGNAEGDGGLQGTFNTPASWTYSITRFDDTTILGEDVDIIAPPHHYRRPNGQMNKATYGLATYDSAGDLIVISCNETIIGATC